MNGLLQLLSKQSHSTINFLVINMLFSRKYFSAFLKCLPSLTTDYVCCFSLFHGISLQTSQSSALLQNQIGTIRLNSIVCFRFPVLFGLGGGSHTKFTMYEMSTSRYQSTNFYITHTSIGTHPLSHIETH